MGHRPPSASGPVLSGAARGGANRRGSPTPEKTRMEGGGGRWAAWQTGADTVPGGSHLAPRRRHQGRADAVPAAAGVRPADGSKRAPVGAAVPYSREQMCPASFSALPQSSPSVSRPILFAGKQQKPRFSAWLLKAFCPRAALSTCKRAGTSLTSRREMGQEGAGPGPCASRPGGNGGPPPSEPHGAVCKGGDPATKDCFKGRARW